MGSGIWGERVHGHAPENEPQSSRAWETHCLKRQICSFLSPWNLMLISFHPFKIQEYYIPLLKGPISGCYDLKQN